MTTPFLAGFAEAVVDRLLDAKLLELSPDHDARTRAILFVANWLGTRGEGASLVSSLEAGLLACAEVSELYVDVERLKGVIDDLR